MPSAAAELVLQLLAAIKPPRSAAMLVWYMLTDLAAVYTWYFALGALLAYSVQPCCVSWAFYTSAQFHAGEASGGVLPTLYQITSADWACS